MTSLALILVLSSALGHSGWNYLTKSSRYKVTFLWLMLVAAGVIYGIPFWYRLSSRPIPADGWPYILATGLIHSLYFSFLGMAYRRGDLSTVYPIARGTAPALVPFVAMLYPGEFPSALGSIGIAMVVIGIQIVGLPGLSKSSLGQFWQSLRHGPVGFAFLTGLMTTIYTVVDRQGVQPGRVDPFVYIYLQMVLTAFFLTPWMIARKRDEIRYEWTVNKWRAAAVGLLCVGTYLLILSAMRLPVKVSYIAAGRECSILFSTLFGILLLHEPRGLQKVIGALVIVLGVGCIALAR
jgi:drug/metabolite transporter (DMT)-like permease